MIQTFTIPGRLASLNDLISATNRNRFFGNDLKRKNTLLCAEWAIASRLQMITEPIGIKIRWIERDARRDLDNIASGIKYILDGLVEANKIPNDTRHWVRSIHHEFPDPDKANPRIEIDLVSLAHLQ